MRTNSALRIINMRIRRRSIGMWLKRFLEVNGQEIKVTYRNYAANL